jgi:hypothetical protein
MVILYKINTVTIYEQGDKLLLIQRDSDNQFIVLDKTESNILKRFVDSYMLGLIDKDSTWFLVTVLCHYYKFNSEG